MWLRVKYLGRVQSFIVDDMAYIVVQVRYTFTGINLLIGKFFKRNTLVKLCLFKCSCMNFRDISLRKQCNVSVLKKTGGCVL